MKKHTLLAIALFGFTSLFAQLEGVFVEEWDPSVVAPNYVAPEGMTTYRVYAEFASPLDKVSSIYGLPITQFGEAVAPCQQLRIETTTSWYNEISWGSNLGSQIKVALFGFLPESSADSWLTIGAENTTNQGAAEVQSVTNDPPSLNPYFNTENGSSLIMNDGAVFTLFTAPTGFGSGPNNRVLLAQLTTTGQISYQLNLQVFLGNSQANEVRYLGSTGCSDEPWLEVDGSQLGLVYPMPVPSGCTDPGALNFNELAVVDDGSCEYPPVEGCTDPIALNFNELAVVDDGSCEYPPVEGCTDPIALNFNELAVVDDGSCEYPPVEGCTDPIALNFNELAIVDDGSCEYPPVEGCTDPAANNFNALATVDDGSCENPPVEGCTDPAAGNFNSEAEVDDGSCVYPLSLTAYDPELELFPNPTGGDVTVDIFGANGAEALIVTVNDLMGRIIFQRNYGNDQERLRINLESSAYASGVYLLTVQNGAHATTHRLVKQ